ncbi:minor tail protein [Gordonia phage Forza]|uniref:Minor tail protein n=1 Tax=Gordonia phage Forza TaxID=2571247 RepID=A0A650EYG3_9CAUD|nr:minor tail protein [Gordonia phage Forza]QEM41568.1 minor tail protein [Gordonia phage Boopy]QGT55094.1 minor tail protein [Gordonia phage Forza]UXE04242.1 minor tail protein [Gordonia phage BlueNGold]WBF03882.1 minor tail protein [Gordonia phage Mareelih]
MTTPTLMKPSEIRSHLLQRTIDDARRRRERPLIRVFDKDWEPRAILMGEIEASFETRMFDTGTGNIKLMGNHKLRSWLVEELEEEEDVHIVVDVPGIRWSGKVSTITDAQTDNGLEYINIDILDEREHLKKIICYSNPLFPAEFQYPKMFLWAGPSVFGIKTMLFLNLMRRFVPFFWTLPENIFDPASWLANLNPNNWPIVVKPGGFFTDTSMWTVLTTRFGNFHDVVTPTLKDAGLIITTERWLPGDPQPYPSHFTLTKPTLVLDVVDKSGVRGPTGTVLDGLLKLGRTILEDGIQEEISIQPNGEPPAGYSQPNTFFTSKDWPWVCWRNGMRTGLSGVSSWEMTIHKALAGAIVTGGKSPEWVNAGIKLLLNLGLGYLGALIGNPALGLGIFEDQVEDVILAFHRIPHPMRQAAMGRGQYGEAWENAGGTGFSVSALQAIRTGMWKTRAYTSFKVSVINGAPYWVGKHFTLGDRVACEIGRTGRLYVDQVNALSLSWSRDQDPRWEISIGNDEAEEPRGAILGRLLEQTRSFVQALGVDA